MSYERLARAKVNLMLHVGPVGDDGYHPLCSLVTFADVGDVVRFELAREMAFAVEGPFAEGLSAESNNLVTRARDLVLANLADAPKPFRLSLEKRLPIAAGLGGGSADAAATLNMLGEIFDWNWLDETAEADALAQLAAPLGADLAMCLAGVPAIAEGRGDDLGFPPPFPTLEAVLVNPLKPSSTGAVYRAYDEAGAPGGADEPDWPDVLETPKAVADFLAGCRNDLEAPAISLQPAIAEVLAALRAPPETLIARMSGSGATCFALCADRHDRTELARDLTNRRPDWWVQPCQLMGYGPDARF